MPAVKFICATMLKANHEEIKSLVYLAGGAIVREKIRQDSPGNWQAELEIVSEGGTLFRQVKELQLAGSQTIIPTYV